MYSTPKAISALMIIRRRWSSFYLLMIMSTILSVEWTSTIARAQEVAPDRPLLRIETGSHTAPVFRMDVDAAEHYLVTASKDQTVRVWDLHTGALLRVLRSAANDGYLGQHPCAAISPDGSTVAAGDADAVELFHVQTGQLFKRIGAFENQVSELRYSKDGRFLAVLSWFSHRVRIFRTSDYRRVAQDDNHGDTSNANFVDFAAPDFAHPGGRLVTGTHDGQVRLYDLGAHLPALIYPAAVWHTSGGINPSPVSFSPDGSRIAVGLTGTARVAVLSAQNLSLLYYAGESARGGNTWGACWSEDGRFLYSGETSETGRTMVRSWDAKGRGPSVDTLLPSRRLWQLHSLQNDRVLFLLDDPLMIGQIDAAGHATILLQSQTAHFSTQQFKTSHDGTTVQFTYDEAGQVPAWFSVRNSALSAGLSADPTMAAALTDAPGLNIEHLDGRNTSVNGKQLEQVAYEDAAWNNGAFTKALVEGITGKADYNHNGKITVNMLDLYISTRVKALTDGRQTPTTTKPQSVPDFPIAVKR